MFFVLEVGSGFVPVVGEAQDIAVLVGPGDQDWWVRGLAGVSLAVNLFTIGFAPNLGGFLRGGESVADGAADASRAAKGLDELTDAAEGASRAGVRRGVDRVPTPTVKGAGKIADAVPRRVPRNWSRVDIEDAITDYQRSIRIRKAEAADFDAIRGGGHVWARKAHYERIVLEEDFLRQLLRKLEDLR